MPKILVVEDIEEHRKLISDILRIGGYETVEAANGQEALDVLQDQGDQIDLVTLDYSMPVMSGAEFLEAVRRDEQNGKRPKIPVVVITVFITDREVKKMKKLADDFLPKLLSYKDILRTVRKVLKKAGE